MAFSMLRGAQHGACAQGSAPAWLPVRVPALVILPATRSARPQTTSAASSSCQVPALPARLFSATGHRAAGRRSRDVVTACLATNGTPAAGKQKLELTVAGKKVVLETGEIGRQASGAVVASMGDTVIYTTACAAPSPTSDGSFVPLTVNYAERFSAAGRTSGGFVKRDGRPRDTETLVSRLVDRPLRPLFTKGWANETQVLQWVLSYDSAAPPEPLAITASSAALLLSDIPFQKAMAGVRVGWINGAPVVNPTSSEMEQSTLDLILAGTRDAVLMIEGFCDLLSEEDMLKAISVGSEVVSSMCVEIEQWAQRVGKAKNTSQLVLLPEGLEDQVTKLVGPELRQLYSQATSKDTRTDAEAKANAKVLEALVQTGIASAAQAQTAFKNVCSNILREQVLNKGVRIDGRGLTDIRPITCRAGLLPRTHGSCLFTRGETQAIAVTTLGSKSDSQKSDSIRSTEPEESLFYLHYFFPPSSVGEVGRVGAPGRRELGHGELAERALLPVIPPQDQFPYTVRVESTITESNGSSSMATVCGGTLAMLDAGVPIKRPIAGVAMGLILDTETGKFVVLSDILGTEDALGDMDFKVAGDAQGCLTAFQMDIKVEGITIPILKEALSQARQGREHVLKCMERCDPAPRRSVAEFAPHVLRLKVDTSKKAALLGPGARNIRQICESTGATSIDLSEDGELEISAPGSKAAQRALEYVKLLTEPIEVGRIFRGARIAGIQAFGVFVELGPGVSGLVHVSELDLALVADIGARFKVGESMDVMVLDASTNKLALSRRAVVIKDKGGASAAAAQAAAAAGVTVAAADDKPPARAARAGAKRTRTNSSPY